jgi:probable HAF family extracellular repeat protein
MKKLISSFCLIAIFFINSWAIAADYTITDLGTLGGGLASAGNAINESGQVVGFSLFPNSADTSWPFHAFLYDNGGLSDLGSLGGDSSTATDINTDGKIVGFARSTNGRYRAFLYENGDMIDLGTPDEDYFSSYAWGINKSGQVVGMLYTLSYVPNLHLEGHTFVYDKGVWTISQSLEGNFSVARNINDSGQVVGLSTISDTYVNHTNYEYFPGCGFLYNDGEMNYLGTLGGDFSEAYDINNQGQIIGFSSTISGQSLKSKSDEDDIENEHHAFLYENGDMIDLGTLGGIYSRAFGINDSGQVVGYSTIIGDSESHAFIYSNETMIDLNSFTINGIDDWDHLTVARSINNLGQIVGWGLKKDGSMPAFLLTPSVNEKPIANAGEDQTIILGEFAYFDGVDSNDPDGVIFMFDWDFGDGNYGLEEVVEHLYSSPGTYEVTLTVTDNDGDTGTSTTLVTVLTPTDATQELIFDIEDMGLHGGTENSLLSKLESAINSLDKGKDNAAINKLGAFINHAEAQAGKKLTEEEAEILISAAYRIIDSINIRLMGG